jgi:hypothetical protein
MSSNLTNHSTLNSEHNWEDFYNHLRNQQTCSYETTTKSREVRLSTWHFFAAFQLICQCNKSCCRVRLINISWITWGKKPPE